MHTLPENFIPILLHKIDFMEWNVQMFADFLCILPVLVGCTSAVFISQIPIFHEHTSHLIAFINAINTQTGT